METFKINKQGDLDINNGELCTVSGMQELIQAVWLTLNINKGEWFLDNELGLDYTVFMEDKFYNENKIARAIEEAILQEPRVSHAEITKLELDKNKREMLIKGQMTNSDGITLEIREVIEIE